MASGKAILAGYGVASLAAEGVSEGNARLSWLLERWSPRIPRLQNTSDLSTGREDWCRE